MNCTSESFVAKGPSTGARGWGWAFLVTSSYLLVQLIAILSTGALFNDSILAWLAIAIAYALGLVTGIGLFQISTGYAFYYLPCLWPKFSVWKKRAILLMLVLSVEILIIMIYFISSLNFLNAVQGTE
jgi:hypothetical protein